MAERVVVLGGQRSGKSAVAEGLVRGAPSVHYVATGWAGDDEMAARIAAHRLRRPADWVTVETTDLAAAVRGAPPRAAILIDSLGAWVTQRLWPADGQDAPSDETLLAELDAAWIAAEAHPGGPVVIVAEETGLGVVAADPGTRRWVDLMGTLTQRLSQHADQVLLVVAGRVVPLPARVPEPRPAVSTTHDLRAHGDRMIAPGALDFAVNVNLAGPPPHIRKALDAADPIAYPDQGPAVAAIAARHGRDPAEVAVTAGAAEAFWLLARALPARLAAVVHPQFTEPEAALRAVGIPVTHVIGTADTDWRLDPDAVPDDADLVMVGNPNNPTGTLDPPGVLAALCRPGRHVVVDEAFMDFVADPDASLADRADLPGLIVVRSVTKLWGLAGIRAGYLLGAAELVARLGGLRQPWPVSAPGLAVLEACATDEDWRLSEAAEVARWRAHLLEGLRGIAGVRASPSAANFVLARVPNGGAVQQELAARGVAVRPSTFPGLGADYLRIAVREPETTDVLLEALAAAICGHHGNELDVVGE